MGLVLTEGVYNPQMPLALLPTSHAHTGARPLTSTVTTCDQSSFVLGSFGLTQAPEQTPASHTH